MSCCNNINIRTTAVAFDDTASTLTYTVGANSFSAGKPYNIVFAQPIPADTTINATISITDGTNTYQVFTRKGYPLLVKNIINKNGLRVCFNGVSLNLRNFIEV